MLPQMPAFSKAQLITLGVICSLAMGLYWFMTSRAFVSIDVDVGYSTNFRFYWAQSDGDGFSEKHSKKIHLTRSRHSYSTVLTDLRKVDQLRIDPTNKAGNFRIKAINIYQAGYKTIRLHKAELKKLQAHNQVDAVKLDSKGLFFRATGNDPNFLYDLKLEPEPSGWLTHLLRIGLILAMCLLALRLYPKIPISFGFVPVAMALILLLITIMALISRPHAHPDEHAHFAAANYYENHLSLPQVCDQDSLASYTVYGTSRLNADELTYYVAGRYLQLVAFIPVKNYTKLRFFNVLLFGLLILMALRAEQARLLLTPLLLSPQLWYLFSYFNSDASALFVAFLIGYQVVVPGSSLQKLLRGQIKKRLWAILGLGLLATFLFLTKKNFYFFTLFLFAAAVLLAWQQRQQWPALLKAAKPLRQIVLIGFIGFSGWHLAHAVTNDFARSKNMSECREQTARKAFKPSTPLQSQQWTLNMRERDIDIPTMLGYGWSNAVFQSAFGNYGYVNLPASAQHYMLVKLLLAAMLLTLIWGVILRGNAFHISLLGLNFLLFLALVAITLYKSWTVDFQPQGRYYFAMVPMFGVTLVWLQSVLNKRLLSAIMLALCALGMVSFVLYGLLDITKVS